MDLEAGVDSSPPADRQKARYMRNSDDVFPGGSSRTGRLLISVSNMISLVGPKSSRSTSFRRSSSRNSSSDLESFAVSADSNLGSGNHPRAENHY